MKQMKLTCNRINKKINYLILFYFLVLVFGSLSLSIFILLSLQQHHPTSDTILSHNDQVT